MTTSDWIGILGALTAIIALIFMFAQNKETKRNARLNEVIDLKNTINLMGIELERYKRENESEHARIIQTHDKLEVEANKIFSEIRDQLNKIIRVLYKLAPEDMD